MPTGVAVAVRVQTASAGSSSLQTGDVLHSVNETMIYNLEDLRRALGALKSGDPVAVLVERSGQLQYVTFRIP